jgi:hypothetical protein
MRRNGLLLSLVVVLLGGTVLQASFSALAQDGAPAAADEMQVEEGTFAPVGFAEGVSLPSTADLIAARFTFDPGAVTKIVENDPTIGLLIVESGAFTILVDTPWTISRAALVQQVLASSSGEELDATVEIAADQEATLEAGDVAYIPGNVSGEIRNAGQEPAVGTVFLVAPVGTLSGEGAPEAAPGA